MGLKLSLSSQPGLDPSLASVREKSDALVREASHGKFTSVAALVHFSGKDKAANRLRAELTRML
ncbi:MAG: hypothetical protein ACK53K_07960, partial [Burkholderiales bacterium]